MEPVSYTHLDVYKRQAGAGAARPWLRSASGAYLGEFFCHALARVGQAPFFQHFPAAGGGPRLTDSNGVPWMGSYVNANSDLTASPNSMFLTERLDCLPMTRI